MLSHLIPLTLPEPPLKLAKKNNQPYVWDALRKKYLLLTPEEWVRQHIVHYLINLGYPQGSFALEGGFRHNRLQKRTDVLIYKDSRPALLVECKAPQVTVSQATLDQASRYNLHYKAAYILLSNGLTHICARIIPGKNAYSFIDEIPTYDQL